MKEKISLKHFTSSLKEVYVMPTQQAKPISHTKLGGSYTCRMPVGNMYFTQAFAQRAWELV